MSHPPLAALASTEYFTLADPDHLAEADLVFLAPCA